VPTDNPGIPVPADGELPRGVRGSGKLLPDRHFCRDVGATVGTALWHWLSADPPVPLGPLMTDVLDRLTAGPPAPAAAVTPAAGRRESR
jgi:hypothetical protein